VVEPDKVHVIYLCLSQDQLELCRVHVLKSQPIYSKLMQDYGIEDAALFAYACAFDWELLEQHFKSGQYLAT